MSEPSAPGEYIKVWVPLDETPYWNGEWWTYTIEATTIITTAEPLEVLCIPSAVDGMPV